MAGMTTLKCSYCGIKNTENEYPNQFVWEHLTRCYKCGMLTLTYCIEVPKEDGKTRKERIYENWGEADLSRISDITNTKYGTKLLTQVFKREVKSYKKTR